MGPSEGAERDGDGSGVGNRIVSYLKYSLVQFPDPVPHRISPDSFLLGNPGVIPLGLLAPSSFFCGGVTHPQETGGRSGGEDPTRRLNVP